MVNAYAMKKIPAHIDFVLAFVSGCISLIAFLYFYFHGHANLSYYDAIARLDTARKMIDSITPGIGQLGGIWLPFPQMFMLPFIWNNFLWHSGIAGYFISGTSFVIGAVYMQKAVYVLTNSRKTALLIWFLFVSNINILLIQTMAMSEPFYLCFFILTFYFFLLWMKNHDVVHLMQTAFCVMMLTLTRYEGYFIFFGVLCAVAVECACTYKWANKQKIEGILLLFLTISGFGIFLWCIYSALFYKNPLFWLYAYTPASGSYLQSNKVIINQIYGITKPNLYQSLLVYSSVVVWTSGIIPVILAAVGVIVSCFRPTRIFLMLLLISTIFFIFLVFGYYKSFIPHIEFPPVILEGINIRAWSLYADNNVRYGIVFFPCILIFAALAAAKNKFFYTIVMLFAAEQLFFTFVNPTLLQYPFYKSWRYPDISEVYWFRQHYNGGLVLIAASGHEDFIFQTSLPYNKFIYEGTRQYWNDSMVHPSKFAKWVIYDDSITNDDVTLGMTQKGVGELKNKYQLVFIYKGFHIYKLKSQYKQQLYSNKMTRDYSPIAMKQYFKN